MERKKASYKTIDEYTALFPDSDRKVLESIRKVIREAAPEATEKISYDIPTFVFHGNLVHFAAYENHIGFYPGANGVSCFKDRLGEYKTGKGTIQFPKDKPLPYNLITEIVKFRVNENAAKKKDRKNCIFLSPKKKS